LAGFTPLCSSSALRECVLDAGDDAKLYISELRMLTETLTNRNASGQW
jgi:hypothetical protein